MKEFLKENWDDKEIVLARVRDDGTALQWASDRLKDDPETVLAACAQDGRALEHASERLQDDPEIVLAAVRHTGWALRYASTRLKNDPEVVLAAVQQWEAAALRWMGSKIKLDITAMQGIQGLHSPVEILEFLVARRGAEQERKSLDQAIGFIVERSHAEEEKQNLALAVGKPPNCTQAITPKKAIDKSL